MNDLSAHDPSHGRLGLLYEEIEKRKLLTHVVDELIKAHFVPKNKKRVQRNVVHELIANKLGLVLSNRVRAFVNERMQALGYPMCILHGYLFFRHVQAKETRLDT